MTRQQLIPVDVYWRTFPTHETVIVPSRTLLDDPDVADYIDQVGTPTPDQQASR